MREIGRKMSTIRTAATRNVTATGQNAATAAHTSDPTGVMDVSAALASPETRAICPSSTVSINRELNSTVTTPIARDSTAIPISQSAARPKPIPAFLPPP